MRQRQRWLQGAIKALAWCSQQTVQRPRSLEGDGWGGGGCDPKEGGILEEEGEVGEVEEEEEGGAWGGMWETDFAFAFSALRWRAPDPKKDEYKYITPAPTAAPAANTIAAGTPELSLSSSFSFRDDILSTNTR